MCKSVCRWPGQKCNGAIFHGEKVWIYWADFWQNVAEKAFAEWDLATSLSFGWENQKLKIFIIRNDIGITVLLYIYCMFSVVWPPHVSLYFPQLLSGKSWLCLMLKGAWHKIFNFRLFHESVLSSPWVPDWDIFRFVQKFAKKFNFLLKCCWVAVL